jgi:hypothetical protein
MKTTRIRGAVAIAAVGLLTLSAAACGDDDDKGSDAATTTAASTGNTTGATTAGSSGGDASSATEEEYLAAIEAQFTGTGSSSMGMSEAQAKCVAPKWLDVITVAKLKDKGITPDQIKADTDNAELATLGLSQGDAETMYAAFGDCDVNVKELMAKSVATSTGQDDVQDCVEDALPDDLVQKAFTTSITKGDAGLDSDESLTTDLLTAIEKCIPTTSGTS